MNTVLNKKFEAFCKEIDYEVLPELKNTELEILNDTYSGNDNEKLRLKIKFNNEISLKCFRDFYLYLKKLKSYDLKVEYEFCVDQYKKKNIISFIDELAYKKARFKKLKELNFKRIMTLNKDFSATVSSDNIEFKDKYKSIFISLQNKLNNYGFKELTFNFKTPEQTAPIELKPSKKEQAEKQKRINEFVKAQLKRQKQNLKSSGRRGRSKTKNYKDVSLEDVKTLPEYTNITIEGQIFKKPEVKNFTKTNLIVISISDYNEAVECRWFMKDDLPEEDDKILKEGNWIRVNGSIPSDDKTEMSEFIYVDSIEQAESMHQIPEDKTDEKNKRIELHVSTKMNTMDGLVSVDKLVKRAKHFGMKAVGIMDTDGVQNYPDLYFTAKKEGIKAIYGTAFSAISKANNSIYGPLPTGELKNQSYISFDLETTGLSPRFNEIIEFGAVEINTDFKKKNTYQFFVKPNNEIPKEITKITGITNNMVEKKGINQKEALQKIYDILNNKIALAHNAKFDFNFLKEQFRLYKMPFPNLTVIDTMIVSRIAFPKNKRHRLEDISNRLGVKYDVNVAHRADYDAKVLADVWIHVVEFLYNAKIETFEDLTNFTSSSLYSKTYPNEITTIALNNEGLKKQFTLVSECLTKNFYGGPITFIEDLENLDRKNILVGSGTLKGRLLDKYFYSSNEDFLNELKLYDFIEIPAPMVFKHWIKYELVSRQQLEQGLKEIIQEAKKQGKIVIATADVKYLDAFDKLAFEVLVYAKGIKNARHYLFNYERAKNGSLQIPDQYFLTTEEMKKQFAFLKDEKLIHEIVVENTNKIVDLAENIQVIKDKLFTPNFDDSAKKLHDLVYNKAHEIYGETLPEIVQKRIESELNPIIKFGFDVIYWISHKLVKESVDDGYVVGSRGSVGSSFVATLAGISEVNPLVPHYVCNNCKHFELANNPEITSGFDLDDKKCPKCSNTMKGDGHSIPFEIFLGFNGDKVPDIDLNFSGDYQSIVHDKTKNLFGKQHTFRAGTIATVAEKTAFGYAKAYTEETAQNWSITYINFIATKLEGIKRTTGQHPGGIIIIPKEYDVFDFTPINYPANETSSSWYTTHFDYHAIEDNVLKLDLLGHDNPTIIKMCENYTGVNIDDIPKNDKKVLSLFNSVKELKISSKEISNETTGALGLPEFGTPFVRQMLQQTKPSSFADLISISGLSHGTDVWRNNAQDLVLEKGLTLKEVICCRDDIMNMLIKKGVDDLYAFKIMEKVRKGRGLTKDEEKELKKYKVTNWQIDSMNKIKYMFPKAHATAYCLMAWWIAWFKLYHPLAFYASYYATHAKAIDIASMIDKKYGNKVSKRLHELNSMGMRERSTKENDLIPVLEVTQELYARGYNIENINIHKSLSHEWIVDTENKSLIPPFDSMDGLGPAVADMIIKNRDKKEYRSKKDFETRSGINKTVFKKMDDMGVFNNMAKSDQFELF